MLVRSRRFVTPLVLGVAIAAFAGLAATSQGFPVQRVSLNDGGIWVTNNNLGLIGRFTKPIAQLDGELAPASQSSSVNVWQDGSIVAAYDATGGRLYAVNVFTPAFYDAGVAVDPVQSGIADPVPIGIALNDTTLAVLDADHALRVATLSAGGGSLAALSAAAKPLAKDLPANSAVAVGADDTVWVAGGGELRGYPDSGGPPTVTSLPPTWAAGDPMQVTTVGDVPVVADAATKTIYLPDGGHTVHLPAADTSTAFELQQSSGAADAAIAATTQALYSVNLGSGQLTTLSGGHGGTVAAPVQVAGCVHAAWSNGDTGVYVRACGASRVDQTFPIDDTEGTPSLVFRVNNDSVVLNDTTDGGVFLVDTTPVNAAPKWAPSATDAQSSTKAQAYPENEKTKITANPYTQGVRPGTTTVVHVLDVDKGPPGATYVVSAVGAPDQPGVTVTVAPDAQTVLATVSTLSTDAHFQYTIDDGHGHLASNEVTLVPMTPSQVSQPVLKPYYQQPSLSVASAGTLVVPVIGDWRDFDGDPLYIESDSVKPSAGSAAVTSGDALSFTAPQTAHDETVTLSYGVTDGRVARPTMATLKVNVLGSGSDTFIAPTTEPEAAEAVVGAPVTLQPLANSLPGVDPTNPDATLALAGPVPAVPGATVTTDLAAGTVTFTAQHPGDFLLTYTDAFGAAPTANGTIRVHVNPASGSPKPPVTTPEVAVLHGQQPAVVDALAGDYDPQGWILGVTAAATSDQGVQVTVVDQRWLRISADNPEPGMTATVDYTVSDGPGTATGTVAVSAVPADPNDDQITTQVAAITVMAGDSAAVPVLAGDASSGGLPLSLAGDPPTATPPVAGLLASVQGADIRVVAPPPASVKTEEETSVSYVATDADGTTATGELDVTIEPTPSKAHPDQAPAPQEVDARETAGDVEVIQIPVYGVDPEGDSVTVTGVTVPPALGRIVAIGPDSVSYQSYPDSVGTDTFTYQVTDPYGLTGTAQVRIAVLPPGPPQPPVATDVVLNAPPGAALHWNVLAADYVAPGDAATIEPLSKANATVPSGVRLAGDYVYLRVPASPSDPPVQFTYGVTDGSTPSLAQVIVHAVLGAKVPPIANDVVAPPPPAGAATVTVNVLKNDDDPVGSPGDLRVSWVPDGVTVRGAELTIKLAAQPREAPYQITAPDGLTATAVVYVPGTAAAAIRLKPGARITLKRNGSLTVPLSSVLTDTSGRHLKITTLSQLSASPAGDLTVSANQASAFQVRALGGYTGPGAVTVQVYDGATLQDPHGNTATITIPAQVGPDVPILRCPTAPLLLVEGGAPVSYDIGQLCHVWVDTTVATPAPRYTIAWGEQVGGVGASVPGGTGLELTAASGATPGSTGTLRVIPAGATTGGTLNVEVISAPLPTGRAVSVSVDASRSVSVDLSQYVTSPLAQPDIQVLSVTHPAGATVASSGSMVTIAPVAGTHGSLSLVATVTDVAGRSDRAIPVSITVTVAGYPGTPGQPSATPMDHGLTVQFDAAAPNGAEVQYYTVYTNGAAHQCSSTSCLIGGLTNGTNYAVYVSATNSVGSSRQHSATVMAEPNALPGPVTGVFPDPGDGEITLSWQPEHNDGTPPTHYEVAISPVPPGQQRITTICAGTAPCTVTSTKFSGLTNGTPYTFEVQAVNQLSSGVQGVGPWTTAAPAVPFGKPIWGAAAPSATAAVPADPALSAVTVSWLTPNDNGATIKGYSVQEYSSANSTGPWAMDGAASPVAFGTNEAPFTVSNDGTWYAYVVTATNEAGPTESAQTAAIQAATLPATPAQPVVAAAPASTGPSYGDGTVDVTFIAPAPHAAHLVTVNWSATGPGGTVNGAWDGPFTEGASYTEPITGLTDGDSYAVTVAGCNDAANTADNCGQPSPASAPVTPYGAPGAPTVSMIEAGTSITYSWSGGGGAGQPVANTYVCVNGGGCVINDSGQLTVNYGYSAAYSFYAYVVDAVGQQSPNSNTLSGTTPAPPPPPAVATVTVAKGNVEIGSDLAGGCAGNAGCYNFYVSVANFNPGATLTYSCIDDGDDWWSADESWSGTLITANNSFNTQCLHYLDGSTVTIRVTDGTHTASGSFKT